MATCIKRYIERVYVAGPITPRGLRTDTSNSAIEYLYNVKEMLKVGAQLINNGYAPFIPCMDFPLFLIENFTPEQIYTVGLAWLEKSDAMLLMQCDPEKSPGVMAEVEKAKELGIPVFNSISEINEYMCGGVKEA